MFEPVRMKIISVGDNLCQNVDIQTDGMCHDGPTIQARVVNAMVKLHALFSQRLSSIVVYISILWMGQRNPRPSP
jgi:hypothetical protein